MKVKNIPLDQIALPDLLVRQTLDPEAQEQLCQSIQRDGLLQPIVVTDTGEAYLLLDGYRRLRAFKTLGIPSIPANVFPSTSPSSDLLPLVANAIRQDIGHIDLAHYFKYLNEECGLTHDQIALAIGKDRTTVTHIIALLELPEDTQQAIQEGKLAPTIAVEISRMPTPEKATYYTRAAIEHGCTLRKARYWRQQEEALIRPPASEERPAEPEAPTSAPAKYQTACQVCGKVHEIDALLSIYVCDPCWAALETVKAQQAQAKELR